MMKEVVQGLETGLFAQIGLVAFLLAFTLILIYVVRLPRAQRDQAKNIPLVDDNQYEERK